MQLAFRDAAQSHHEFTMSDTKAGRITLDEHAADPFGAGAVSEARVDEIEP